MKVTLLEPTGTLTIDMVQDVLSLIDEVPPPRSGLEHLTPLELAMIYDYAMREHLTASDNRMQRRRKPGVLDLFVHCDHLEHERDAAQAELEALEQERDVLLARIAALEEQVTLADETPGDASVH